MIYNNYLLIYFYITFKHFRALQIWILFSFFNINLKNKKSLEKIKPLKKSVTYQKIND